MRWFNLFRKNNIENAVIDNPFRIQLREKHEGQIGYVVSIPRVRILYPRGKNRGDICVADLFSIILWDTIDENYCTKNENSRYIAENTAVFRYG